MDFPAGLFGNELAWTSWAVLVAVWVWCLRTGPWRRLAESSQSNVWLGTIVLLVLIWSMKANVRPGMHLHLLGATMFALMFGRQLAIIGLSLVLAAATFNSVQPDWQTFGINALASAVLPCLIAWVILRAVERWLPAHFFVYIFVAAFFGAGLTTVLTGAVSTLLLAAAGAYTIDLLLSEYFPFYLLLGFAEAWLTGALITLMVVYYPHWVGTFDDRRYLWNK